MSKSRTMWLTRDKGEKMQYLLWSYKSFPWLDDELYAFHAKAKAQLFSELYAQPGIHLKPGEKVKVRLEIVN